MSEPSPSTPTEPTFDQFRDFARRIIAVPKAEADKKEQEWREQRKATAQKKRNENH
jgi:hypothetical protein